jgi:hypothetical protein
MMTLWRNSTNRYTVFTSPPTPGATVTAKLLDDDDNVVLEGTLEHAGSGAFRLTIPPTLPVVANQVLRMQAKAVSGDEQAWMTSPVRVREAS